MLAETFLYSHFHTLAVHVVRRRYSISLLQFRILVYCHLFKNKLISPKLVFDVFFDRNSLNQMYVSFNDLLALGYLSSFKLAGCSNKYYRLTTSGVEIVQNYSNYVNSNIAAL